MSFTALYSGQCGSCEQPIQPGDEIEHGVDDVYIHANCQEIEDVRMVPGAVCPICWLTQPCEHTEDV